MLAKCTLCYGEKTITDDSTGEVICNDCGTVLAENIEVSSERRAFSKEEFESRSHTGAPNSLARHDMGLSTVIGRSDRDASGRRIDADMKATMNRLRTWDFRSQASDARNRSLMFASNELNKLKDKLALTDTIIEKAAYIYRKAQEKKLVRGRTMIALAAASLYAACRELYTQRALKDVASASHVKMKDLSRTYRLLVKELGLQIPVTDQIKCVTKIANLLGLSTKTVRDAARAMEEIKQHGGSAGKDPMGLAGTALYLIALKNNEEKGQKAFAQAADVTEVTIRNRAKELRKNYPELFNL